MGRSFRALLAMLVMAVPVLVLVANAQTAPPPKRVQASLVAEQQVVTAGSTVWLALVFQIEEHWHTYWRNPGDSGLQTRVSWQFPQYASAGPIVWPVPERIPYGPLVNYGYSNEVIHLIPVTLAPDLPADVRTLELAGTARWLVCSDVCIPESVQLSIPLTIGDAAELAPSAQDLFKRARSKLPLNAPGIASKTTPLKADFVRSGEQYDVRVPLPPSAPVRDAYFFASATQTLDHAAEQDLLQADGLLSIALTPSADRSQALTQLSGILVVETATGRFANWVSAEVVPGEAFVGKPLSSSTTTAKMPGAVGSGVGELGLWLAMLLAMAGGLILNLMPCVLPVISLKAVSLVESAAAGATNRVRAHGLVYAVGVVLSFVVLGAGLLFLRGAGHELGWGFQLQNPLFVGALALLMYLIGLNLSGVFELGSALSGAGDSLTRRSGLSGSFFTGVLAVVVASPCTAPFMGVAMGFAMTVPPAQSLLVFASLGVGLALPYLLISLWPSLTRLLPRPGAWMASFKQLLAFPMYATAIWLAWVLAAQRGPNGVGTLLAVVLLVSFAIWCWQRSTDAIGWARAAARVSASVALVAVLFLGASIQGDAGENDGSEANLVAQPYSEQTLDALQAEDKAVFVNLTADWCITCLFNERATLRSSAIARRFEEKAVVYLKGDWTNYDPQITMLLERFGRTGVPLYVLFPPPSQEREPIVLPQILTEAEILGHLKAL